MEPRANITSGRSTVFPFTDDITFEDLHKHNVTTKPTFEVINTVHASTMTSYAAEISTLSHGTVINVTNSSSLHDEDSNLDFMFNVVALIVFPVIILGILFGNSLVITAYWRNKKLQTVTYEFIMLLAVADFVVGISLIPNLIFFASSTSNFNVCILRFVTFLSPCVASILFILFNTINTYMSVVRSLPLTGQKRMSQWIKNIGIAVTVFLSCTVGIVMPFTWNNVDQWGMEGNPKSYCKITLVLSKHYFQFLIPCIYIIGMIATGLYIALFCNVRNRTDEMLRTLNQPTQNVVSRLKTRHIKTAKTLMLVMGLFYLFYLPYSIVVSCEVFGNLNVPFMTDLRVYTSFLLVCNSAINPIIYAFRLKPFQKEWARMLQPIGKCFKKNKK